MGRFIFNAAPPGGGQKAGRDMLILISDAFGPSLPDKLARFGEVTTDKDRLAEADVVLVRSKTKCTREYIDSAPCLKLIIRGGVGMDNIDIPYATNRGIKCINTPEASTTAVAELAFCMMIALPNRVTRCDASMREGKWLKKELKRTELQGKTLGILGLGRIGLALAVRARAFQMNVLGWHPDIHFTDFAEIRDTMEEVVSESDFISLHMPLLTQTAGLIDKKALEQFKDGAFLINTARAGIIVEDDVIAALERGKLGGYATDVWPSDPPTDTKLFKAPNTLLSPHIGASTFENMDRIATIVERVLDEFVASELEAVPA
ncbi:MAG: NAD(P)-dependent oxidoreductase [Planctomycetota bacterium]|jgi:D-3-phosphoglycerate dehydrogenase